MRQPFRLIDPDEAVAWGCLLIFLAVLAFAVDEKPAPQPVVNVRQCDITVAQYGPGERWAPNQQPPTCAVAATAFPNHVLTMPLQETK